MKYRFTRTYCLILLLFSLFIISCGSAKHLGKKNSHIKPKSHSSSINNSSQIDRRDLVSYAESFLGTPYLYGGTSPQGFDCSGLVYYVFHHFNVLTPRVSYLFENVGKEITLKDVLPGDIILFTGSKGSKVGHIGIITKIKDREVWFIHAASQRSGGVINSQLTGYWQKHFVSFRRILK